ncbi:hypothetical protein [Streptomyces flavofungini]|uniref:hypothetical protein n=1 Tax=Streptomyces flavofungini TaxID=68200 RepID=UPI0034DF0406
MNQITKYAMLTGAFSTLLLAAPAATAATAPAADGGGAKDALPAACGSLVSALPPVAAEHSFQGVCELAG